MLKFPTLLIAVLLQQASCSLVMDSISQKGLYLSDYCPKMKYCAEGSHVMCMYYNPHRAMGPRCNRPKNVSITADLADKLLEVSNAVRSKIALGKEKGKGGDLLPKGYGMFRLSRMSSFISLCVYCQHDKKWDNELATFAQVLANQCVLRHDMCRATKRFADPGQTAGLVRFTYPEWFPVSKAGHFTKPGLTASKLAYAITQTLKSWYGQKDAVTPGMITSYPDWAENPNNQGGRLYLEMIYGPATHMGCGISAYTEYAYYDNNAALNYNSIQVICNYSSRPRKGGSVYQTAPPTEVGFTVRCGCPIGMDEDPDCLCIESQRNAITDPPAGRSCSETGHCKPAVVLLPIFTVENAPPEKLIARSGYEMLPFDKKESEPEIADLYGPADNVSVIHPMENVQQTNIHSVLSNIIGEGYSKNDHPTSLVANSHVMETQLPVSEKKSARLGYNRITKAPESVISNLVNEVRRNVDFPVSTPHSRPIMHDVQKRLFGKHLSPLRYHNSKSVRPTFNHILPKKKSVFSKVATFALPKTEESVIKQDVAPRKDFSDVKNLAQDYLSFKKVLKGNSKRSSSYHPFEHYGETSILKTTTERFLHSAEEKVINFNYYLRNYSQPNRKSDKMFSDIESNFPRETPNDKLMTLLDTLEQEVKHIELDRSKKEIFDAKIRRIYGTIVGKTGEMSYKTDRESDFTDTEQTDKHSDSEGKINKFKHHDEVEELVKNVENIHDKYSDFDNEIRPISRSQNSLYIDKVNSLDHRNVKKAKEGYESDMKYPFSDTENLKSRIDKSRYSDGNTIKSRVSTFNDIDKEVLRTRNVYSDNEIKKTKYPEKRKFRENGDPLGVDRRRFYQSKLENLERKLHNTRSFKHHKDNNNRQIRPVLPTAREEQPLRPSKNQLDPFYMPDRARFLHGF